MDFWWADHACLLQRGRRSLAGKHLRAGQAALFSVIVRSVDELEVFGCFRLVHDLMADDTSCCIASALGNQGRCLRIKGSAMRAEEGAAF